jgi:glutamate 5-kinase
MRRVVIKLGSSVVGDERGELRADALERVCDVAAAQRGEGVDVVLVTSGAIARGVRVMGLLERPSAIAELQAASAVGQGKLFPVYDRALGERGLVAAQVLLTAMDMHERARYLNARQTLAKLLQWGTVPVVNENDTTATDEISFGDNDFLAAQVATLVGADLLVLLTDVEGVFTADPRTNPGARLLEELRDFGEIERLAIDEGTSRWGTGGMRRKLIAAEIATAAGVTTVACSGLSEDALGAVLKGEPRGTRFPAQGRGHSSFKLWLKHAKPSRGSVVIDAGAARALRERGGSLLPVGIVAVRGRFEVGDAIDIYEAVPGDAARSGAAAVQAAVSEAAADGGAPLAKGITRFSSVELERVKGLSSAQVREQLPDADEEAVHRDYLVVG